MSWRVVVCRTIDTLRAASGQLFLGTIDGKGEVSVPIEDIDTVILEDRATTLSLAAIQSLASAQVNLIVCDKANLPAATLIPMAQHSRQLDMLQLQVGAKKPLKKSIWSKICQQKIRNQRLVLRNYGHNKAAQMLDGTLTRMRSGDPTNQEAVAAGIYFKALWPATRRVSHPLNSYVNYGYAIIRSSLARYAAGFGLQTALGIHHRASLNPFNLADDLLEPFRAVVDQGALTYYNSGSDNLELDVAAKNHMLKLLQSEVFLVGDQRAGEKASVAIATRLVVQSLIEALRKKDPAVLVLPRL